MDARERSRRERAIEGRRRLEGGLSFRLVGEALGVSPLRRAGVVRVDLAGLAELLDRGLALGDLDAVERASSDQASSLEERAAGAGVEVAGVPERLGLSRRGAAALRADAPFAWHHEHTAAAVVEKPPGDIIAGRGGRGFARRGLRDGAALGRAPDDLSGGALGPRRARPARSGVALGPLDGRQRGVLLGVRGKGRGSPVEGPQSWAPQLWGYKKFGRISRGTRSRSRMYPVKSWTPPVWVPKRTIS